MATYSCLTYLYSSRVMIISKLDASTIGVEAENSLLSN